MMIRFNGSNGFNNNQSLIFPSWNLALFLIIALFFLSTQNSYAVNSTYSGGRMLNLTWDAPENGADHYRIEITRTDQMNEPAADSVFHVFSKINFCRIELEEGSLYSVRIQSVDSYGVFSDFSNESTFAIDNGVITSILDTSNDKTPMDFALSQNFPNPFNPMTTISYSLPDDSHVKLSIFNVAGQKVTELQNDRLKAGTYSVTWDASDSPSGTYIYMISTDHFSHSKKMLLLK